MTLFLVSTMRMCGHGLFWSLAMAVIVVLLTRNPKRKNVRGLVVPPFAHPLPTIFDFLRLLL
jgi:hypothetical protein